MYDTWLCGWNPFPSAELRQLRLVQGTAYKVMMRNAVQMWTPHLWEPNKELMQFKKKKKEKLATFKEAIAGIMILSVTSL